MPVGKNITFLISLLLTGTLLQWQADAQNVPEIRLKTVVIDAGHGGHDPGALSPDRKMQEKTINLDVALKLGELITSVYPDIKVIYTRSTDVFIPLNERTDIANRNHADLFISIHVNSVGGKSSANGIEVFVMGTDKNSSNMEVSRRENSVILLEDDYSTTYQGFDPNEPESYIFFSLMQNAFFEQSINMASCVDNCLRTGPITKSRGVKQAPLLVLWRTTMPAVLIEIGFISSAADRKYLGNAESRNEIASNIFKAFRQFKQQYEKSARESDVPSSDSASFQQLIPPTAQLPDSSSAPIYKIQILASRHQVSPSARDFKGQTGIDEIFMNGYYKYCIGEYATREEAVKELPKIRKLFPQAFVVTVDNL